LSRNRIDGSNLRKDVEAFLQTKIEKKRVRGDTAIHRSEKDDWPEDVRKSSVSPQFTMTTDVNMDEFVLRLQGDGSETRRGEWVSITYTEMIAKIVSEVLKTSPLNAALTRTKF
jgi:hypothetical protein